VISSAAGLWLAWSGVVLLGAYHGLNPGMGWLLAVGRGLQERKRSAVFGSLLPIAIGHEASIAVVLLITAAAEPFLSERLLRLAAAGILAAVAGWLLWRRRVHPRGFGMRMGRLDLTRWSFLMSTAHGAGLMLVPLMLGIGVGAGGEAVLPRTLALAVAAAMLHTIAMVVVMAAIAAVVYDRLGLGILRRAWVNLDLAWAAALLVAGVFAVFTA
jgi:hypothetical protein